MTSASNPLRRNVGTGFLRFRGLMAGNAYGVIAYRETEGNLGAASP